MSQQYDQAQRVQYPTGDSGEMQWTQEQVFGLYNQMTQDYWRSRGFIMPPSHGSPASPSLPSGVPAAPLAGSSIQPMVSQQQQQQSVIVPMPGTPYYLLPQQPYIAKRRYQPQGPIVFRTATTGYISLLDAMNGNLAQLLDGDVSVFSGDNLSQKQSIRLEVIGVKSFERQINVRNPANQTRSITRAKLAEKIAKEIHEFMRRLQSFGDPAFRLGPGTQGFERLVLIEVLHVSRSSWQPVLGVLN